MEKKYQLSIGGMHCTGCKNLITMSLEDEGLHPVSVDENTGRAVFTSAKSNKEIETTLKKIFTELTDYHYVSLLLMQ